MQWIIRILMVLAIVNASSSIQARPKPKKKQAHAHVTKHSKSSKQKTVHHRKSKKQIAHKGKRKGFPRRGPYADMPRFRTADPVAPSALHQQLSLPLTIFAANHSSYAIDCSEDDSAINRVAGTLQKEIREIGMVHLPINSVNGNSHNHIILQTEYSDIEGLSVFALGENGFFIGSMGDDIYLVARNATGLEYAVRYFMEKYAGCVMYTSDAIVRPRRTEWTIRVQNEKQIPAFQYREVYIGEAFRAGYAGWNKLNQHEDGNFKNHPGWGLWVHTMHKLVSPDLIKTHPEYFALRNGVRLTDQLCLSNPDVLQITIESLRKEIDKNPDAMYWSVSQMDNYNFCECEQCHRVDSIEESHAGMVLQFTNQVAKAFPAKIISTLAYQYSRKAPKNIRPRINVNIMLCTIECNRAKPIASDSSEGSFAWDLKQWSALTKNILVWDYVTNFHHLILPFPNWQVLQQNIQLFHRYGVRMIFEQGYSRVSGEMQPLRTWLISKWLWNPMYDADSLTSQFLNAYYGKAAPYVFNYLREQTTLLNNGKRALTLYEPPSVHINDYLSPNAIRRYFVYMDDAAKAVSGDSILLHRIEMIRQSIRYAALEISKSAVKTSDWCFSIDDQGNARIKKEYVDMLQVFVKTAIQFGPSILHEHGNTPAEYGQITEKYFQNGYTKHKLIGKNIRFTEAPDKAYSADGPQSLIDGILGTTDYQALWQGWWGKNMEATMDFGSIDSFNRIRFRFLDINQAWIMAPASVTIEISDNGKQFKELARITNENKGKNLEKQVVEWTYESKQTVKSRYIRVRAQNIGPLPEWRGVKGNAWLFADEIIVQ